MSKFKEYAEIFEMLDSQDRLEYLLELSTKSTSLPQQLRSDDRLVRGCMSQIWIDVGLQNNLVKVYYDSDALITKGITSVVADCYSDISIEQAKQINKNDFEQLGIQEILSPQRRNGLGNLINTIQAKVQAL